MAFDANAADAKALASGGHAVIQQIHLSTSADGRTNATADLFVTVAGQRRRSGVYRQRELVIRLLQQLAGEDEFDIYPNTVAVAGFEQNGSNVGTLDGSTNIA